MNVTDIYINAIFMVPNNAFHALCQLYKLLSIPPVILFIAESTCFFLPPSLQSHFLFVLLWGQLGSEASWLGTFFFFQASFAIRYLPYTGLVNAHRKLKTAAFCLFSPAGSALSVCVGSGLCEENLNIDEISRCVNG